MHKFNIKDMTLDDIDAVDKIRQKSWLDSYVNEEHRVTAELINNYFAYRRNKSNPTERLKKVKANIEDKNKYTKVAVNASGEVVGMIFGEKTEGGEAILGALYLDPEYIGGGNGRLLMDGFIDWLGSRVNCDLFVVGYNKRAIDFYKKYGFEISSNKPTKEAHLDDTHPLVEKMKVVKMERTQTK